MQKGLLIEAMKAFLNEKKNVSRLGLGRKYSQIMTFSEMVSKQRDIQKVRMCEWERGSSLVREETHKSFNYIL